MRHRLLLTVASLLIATPLAAQRRRDGMLTADDMQNVKPASCAAADSIAGRPLLKPKEAAQGWREGADHNIISSDLFAFTPHRPVDGIMLNTVYRAEGPLPEVGYTVQPHLRDTVLRTGPAARLTFVLDSVETVA